MQHFTYIPIITHQPTDITLPSAEMRNLFQVLELVVNSPNVIQLYVIEGIKRLDNISYELYGSTEHWWILAKLNNIHDIIFDLPIDEEVLQKVSMDRTLIQYNDISDSGAMDYYITQFEDLVSENDSKRPINIIKPEYLGTILTEIVKNL